MNPQIAAIAAGALYDFGGFITTREQPLVASSSNDAAPVAETLAEFLKKRGIYDAEARVSDWFEDAPGGVYLDAQGRAHGTVSDEQIEAVLLGALADVRKRAGMQSPLGPRLARVAEAVIQNHGLFDDLAESTHERIESELGAALVDEVSSLVFEQANKLVGQLETLYQQRLNEQAEMYEAVARGRLRLIRELDVALNGAAGAAQQASMSDLIAQVQRQQSVQILNLPDGMRINFRAPNGERATLNLATLLAGEAGPVPSTMRAAIADYPVAGAPE